MLVIDTYTANAYRRGLNARVGSYVRISQSADAREYDDFHRGLGARGMKADLFVRWHPRLRFNVYRIERINVIPLDK